MPTLSCDIFDDKERCRRLEIVAKLYLSWLNVSDDVEVVLERDLNEYFPELEFDYNHYKLRKS